MRLGPRTASTLAQLRRNYRKRTGQTSVRAILGDSSGAISVPGEPQYYYVRLANGTNADGTTQYGEAWPVLSGGYMGSEANGTGVLVIIDHDGQWALRTDRGALIEAGLNPRAENPNSPYSKFVDLTYALIGYAVPIGTTTTVSMQAVVYPLVYIDDTGTLKTFAGAQIDFAADVPAADGDDNDMQLIAGLFLNSDNTLETVTSTAKLVGDTLSWDVDVAEVIAARSARAMPLRYFTLYTGQTALTVADEFGDGRQWVNAPERKNNFAAAAAPTVNDDVTPGYEVGSHWYDVTNDNWYVCLDNTDGAAIWQKAVITTPAAAAQNSIVPTADVVPLTITGHAGATANLQNWNGGASGAVSILPTGKVTAGSFGTPNDVTVTREHGVELHFSGNNYNATALRARGWLITTNTTATAQGGVLQASNANGINAGVVQGALIEAIGKSDAANATITTMRGVLVNTEWGAKDTITNLKTLHVRTHTRDSATEGYISGTGYLMYLENEAVGGNGQQLDAGIYLKATNVSTPYAFDYGIDFSGAVNEIATAEIKLSNSETIGNLADGHVACSGSLSSATLTLSDVGPTDDLDVSGVNTVFLDCSGGAVTIGGFTGGIDGQILYIAKLCAAANDVTLEHNHGTGNQDIFLHAGADETLTGEYGGWLLACNGTGWFDMSHSRHV